MTTKNFITKHSFDFTGEELYFLHSGLSSYLDYLRAHNFMASHERASRLFDKVGRYIDAL